MKNTFAVSIALPGMPLLTFEAKKLTIPAGDGCLGIMAGRQPMLTTMTTGIIRLLDVEDQMHQYAITGGFCEMLANQATLLCDSLIGEDQIDMLAPVSEKPVFNLDTAKMSEKEKRRHAAELFRQKLLKSSKQK